ncbi:MAG: histidine phosphotransferase [Hyphomicrobiales bacterium]|nr:histidine phosphotransferase [Hyphomicrobiales bacterium]MDE2017426.1 histidine phosphotransferase [Hyphomicrobiales bacterium]
MSQDRPSQDWPSRDGRSEDKPAADPAPAPIVTLGALDLSALLSSRVCHDVINPVGAITNGLEVLDDPQHESDAEMRGFALDLIRKSVRGAAARLQFSRLAFGAAGSAGASIDTGEAENVARGLFAEGKATLDWGLPRAYLPKNRVKLILNLCQVAMSAVPRGGVVKVTATGEGEAGGYDVVAEGGHAKLMAGVAAALDGRPESGVVDAHSVQPFYAGLIARECGLKVAVETTPERVAFRVTPEAATAEATEAPPAG